MKKLYFITCFAILPIILFSYISEQLSADFMSGVKDDKPGYIILVMANREEFVRRKVGDKTSSIIEYKIIAYDNKKFIGGDIIIDTVSSNSEQFEKQLFFPSEIDSLNLQLIVTDKISERYFKKNRDITMDKYENDLFILYNPLYTKKLTKNYSNSGRGASSLSLTVYVKENKRCRFKLKFLSDNSIFIEEGGYLEYGYNYLNINLTKEQIDMVDILQCNIEYDSIYTYSFPLAEKRKIAHIDFIEKVNQLIYIANKAEMTKLKNAKISERDSLWQDFWKQRDPIPTTIKNEAEIMYFNRVKYTNEHFATYKDGWKTDRGMIYIKYGPPDDIENHSFEIDSPPYEIWYYNKTRKKFIFVDKYGLGDYQLIY
jgi:GWxTD domain-containing protein